VGAAIKLTILAHFGAGDRRAYPVLPAPQQIKKFASGNGNLKKDMLPKEVFKRWDADFKDVDLTVAYVLARMAHAVDAHPDGLTKFQREVVDALAERDEWLSVPERRPRLRRGSGGVLTQS
jgi:hypothetical protein